MISKYSVKKVYSVLVMVILIIVLGVVSFFKMTPDLFPKIDMPYVMVMTSYPGATPEEVEAELTQPMEQQMASLENLKNINSVSSENYSMVLLEFNNDANLDVVSVDIRDKIEMVSGQFNESVQKPIIFKMNPDVIPVTVAAVNIEGKNTVEISETVKEDLLRRMQGIDGVASVSTAGVVDSSVHVTINSDKIESLNKKAKEVISSSFAQGESEINSGISSIESGKNSISNGKTKIENAQKDLSVQKELVSQVLTALRNLYVLREGAVITGSQGLIAQTDAQITEVKSQLKPYEASLKEVGVNLSNINSTDAANLALSNFNIFMNVTSAKLGNQMSELTANSAYLDSLLGQLNSAKSEVEKTKESTLSSVNIDEILTVDNIGQIIAAQNFQMPAGIISEDGKDLIVSVGEKITDVEQLKNLVVLDLGMEGMEPIKMSDVATISYLNNGEDTYSKINGEDGIVFMFSKQSDYSTSKASENIQNEFKSIEKENKNISFTTFSDQGQYIHIVVNSVLQNLLLGAILAIIILLFFLRDIKPTIITALSIPISLTFAVVLMYLTGVSINVISLAGLAVGVGMLVDNSIVVIENIYRLRNLGYSKSEAAIEGARKVSGAITASTLTTICVFVPIIFVEGVTKEIFVDMALTVTYSLLASLFIALTMVPALSSAILDKTNEKTVLSPESRFVQKYAKFVNWSIHHKAIVMILAILLFLGSTGLTLSKGFEYMPAMTTQEISATLELPKDTKQEETMKISNELAEKIKKMEGVETVGVMLESDTNAMLGLNAGGKKWNRVLFYILMDEEKVNNSKEVTEAIDKIAKKENYNMTASGETDMTAAMGGGGIKVDIYSDNLDELRTWAQVVEKEMKSVKGVVNISEVEEESTDELRVVVDKNKAMKKGVTVAQVYMSISSQLAKEKTATNIEYMDNNTDIVLSNSKTEAINREQLKNMTIAVENPVTKESSKIKISEIATFKDTKALNEILHKDQKRTFSITAEAKEGYNITKLNDKIEKKVNKLDLPEGVSVEFGGEDEAIMDAMMQLVLMLLLGVLMIYLIMVAQFQSLLSPFIVMFTVPLAFTGGFLALLISGLEVSVVSMIGFIMLSGVIVNNAIVLIDYIIQLKKQGVEQTEAIISAGATRLRPVLMTAITTILGLVPLALGIGTGNEMIQPVAIVCIGGLLYATLTTLIVIPVMYQTLHRGKKKTKVQKEKLTQSDF